MECCENYTFYRLLQKQVSGTPRCVDEVHYFMVIWWFDGLEVIEVRVVFGRFGKVWYERQKFGNVWLVWWGLIMFGKFCKDLVGLVGFCQDFCQVWYVS